VQQAATTRHGIQTSSTDSMLEHCAAFRQAAMHSWHSHCIPVNVGGSLVGFGVRREGCCDCLSKLLLHGL
jgi:hypothetical protein